MNKKLFVIFCVLFIVIGAAVSVFASIPESQIVGLALTMFGAGGLCSNIWKDKKKETNSFLVILTLVLVGLGSFIAGITGIMTDEKLKNIIALVVALVMIIVGIIVSSVNQKKTE